MLSDSLPLLLAPPLPSSLFSFLLSHHPFCNLPFYPIPLLFSIPFLFFSHLLFSLSSFPSPLTTFTSSPTTAQQFGEGGRVTRASESVVPRLGRAWSNGEPSAPHLPPQPPPLQDQGKVGRKGSRLREAGGLRRLSGSAPHTTGCDFSAPPS